MIELIKNITTYLQELSATQAGKNILYMLLGGFIPIMYLYFQTNDYNKIKAENTVLSQKNNSLLEENKNISFDCDRRVAEAKDKALDAIRKTVNLVDELRGEKEKNDYNLKKVVEEEENIVKKYEQIYENLNELSR